MAAAENSPKLRILAVALLLALAVAPRAGALTLSDLNAGASFSSSDGSLSFSFDPGSVVANGSLPGSLVDYLVTPIVGGFQVSGPAAALNGSVAGLTLSYAVTAGLGLAIDGAALLVTGTALGAGAVGTVGETLSNGVGLAAAITGLGGSQLTDAAAFAGVPSLQVVTGLQLLALGPGDIASIQTLRQTFSVVPELETGLLLAVGLLGLAIFGGSPRRFQAPEGSQRGRA